MTDTTEGGRLLPGHCIKTQCGRVTLAVGQDALGLLADKGKSIIYTLGLNQWGPLTMSCAVFDDADNQGVK